MKTVMFAVLVMTVFSMTGCKSLVCNVCNVVEPSDEGLKVITVTVDADQNFVVNDKVLTVEEFFEQTDFEKRSKLVYLDVESGSAISEETVIKAIRYLESREYVVSMMDGSKYAHLNEICKK